MFIVCYIYINYNYHQGSHLRALPYIKEFILFLISYDKKVGKIYLQIEAHKIYTTLV